MSRSGSAREKWSRIIQEQRESGQTVAAFCAERGIGVSSFYPWKRRLSGSGDAAGVPASGAPAFVEATVRGVSGERGGVSVELPHGRRVAVARGFDRRLLLEVIEALESGGPEAADGGWPVCSSCGMPVALHGHAETSLHQSVPVHCNHA